MCLLLGCAVWRAALDAVGAVGAEPVPLCGAEDYPDHEDGAGVARALAHGRTGVQ